MRIITSIINILEKHDTYLTNYSLLYIRIVIFMDYMLYQAPGFNLNVIETLKGTRTGRPFYSPGVILGSFDIILFASFSKFLSGPCNLMSVILPPSEIIKFT